MRSTKEHADVISGAAAKARGMIRRMAITLTGTATVAKALWQLSGVRLLNGSEVITAEVFGGIGVAARPPETGKPEAIVLMLEDAETPVIVAIRDEKTRAAVAGGLKADESMLHNSRAFVHVKDDGTVEARTPGGTAKRLLTVEDGEALRNAILAWVPVLGDGGTALKTALTTLFGAAPPHLWPTGTKKLKGE